MNTVLLSSLYLAPVQYYSKLFQAEEAIIETDENYQKQSYRNRCIIAAANGPLPLSIPIDKPKGAKCKMRDVKIADHGNWKHLHWNAIISAYNSSPFFEFYKDDFSLFYEKKTTFLLDFNEGLRTLICNLLAIETPVTYTTHFINKADNNTLDLRETIHPKRDWCKADKQFIAKPYYQVFREKHPFIENLSIIDLLFNMGNESRLYLQPPHK